MVSPIFNSDFLQKVVRIFFTWIRRELRLLLRFEENQINCAFACQDNIYEALCNACPPEASRCLAERRQS